MAKHNSLSGKAYKNDGTFDPVKYVELIYSLKEERERMNAILMNLVNKIERLEIKIEGLESKLSEKNSSPILGETDEMLLTFVRKKGKVTAVEVQKHFKYKGRNAASSRLHKLYTMNLLDKVQAGRKVYYISK